MLTVGVSDHGGWAVLVTVAASGDVVDRCTVALKDDDLPGLPHHDESRRLPLADAVAMVERVRRSARLHSETLWAGLQRRLGEPIEGVALRSIPTLPDTIADRITNSWANARADGAMFRDELASAARACGAAVSWFDKQQCAAVSRTPDYVRAEATASRRFAPPWNADHRLALAGAMLALAEGRS